MNLSVQQFTPPWTTFSEAFSQNVTDGTGVYPVCYFFFPPFPPSSWDTWIPLSFIPVSWVKIRAPPLLAGCSLSPSILPKVHSPAMPAYRLSPLDNPVSLIYSDKCVEEASSHLDGLSSLPFPLRSGQRAGGESIRGSFSGDSDPPLPPSPSVFSFSGARRRFHIVPPLSLSPAQLFLYARRFPSFPSSIRFVRFLVRRAVRGPMKVESPSILFR